MKHLTIDELDLALGSAEYVILDFSSPGCAPCKKVPPILEELIEEMAPTDIKAFEVDVAQAPQIAQKFMVLGVPTIIVFKNQKEIKRLNSVPKKEKLKKIIQ